MYCVLGDGETQEGQGWEIVSSALVNERSGIAAGEVARYLAEGQFPPGSMGPKIEAGVRFLDEGGRAAIVARSMSRPTRITPRCWR